MFLPRRCNDFFHLFNLAGTKVYKALGPYFTKLGWVQSDIPIFLFHLIERMRNDIGRVTKAVKTPVAGTAKSDIRAKNEFITVKVLKDLGCF